METIGKRINVKDIKSLFDREVEKLISISTEGSVEIHFNDVQGGYLSSGIGDRAVMLKKLSEKMNKQMEEEES